MKKYILPILGMVTLPVVAQNMTDAVSIASKDIAGSARYRAMGGAFGALGGEVSAMGDNPAGLGVFRGSDQMVLTPSLSINTTGTNGSNKIKSTKADAAFSNLGFVMSFKTSGSSSLSFVNFGVNIRHSEGINRKYKTALSNAEFSMGEYMANRACNALLVDGHYGIKGYLGTDDAWSNNLYPLSTLVGYNSYAIDDELADGNTYTIIPKAGVDKDGYSCVGNQQLYVKQKTRMDEYDINLAANWDDFFYAGLTVSIADYSSITNSGYYEDFGSGQEMDYYNDIETKGSGASVKAGMLIRPTDQLRIGAAVHSPTWIKLTDYYSADSKTHLVKDRAYSGSYDYRYRYFSPWEYQLSAAYIFGKKGLVSVEYDMTDYATAKMKKVEDDFGGSWSVDPFADLNDAMQNDYLTLQHTIKAGAEYRLTNTMSLRAGYVFKSSPYQSCTFDNVSRSWTNGNFGDDNTLLFDSSTKPNYTLLNTQQYFSCGVGWRWKDWFLDLSVQDRIMKEKVASFPTTDAIKNVNYDDGYVEFSNSWEYGAVRATYVDMVTNSLRFDLTIGMTF